MPIKTYTFGLLDPTFNGDIVEQQMLLAHRYRNVLTEIERERLEKVRAALAAHVDVAAIDAEIAPVAAEFEASREAIKRQRSATRSRSDTAAQRARVKELGAQLRELRVRRKAARDAIAHDPEVRAKIDEAEEFSRERVRQARKTCGVYWGTYILQEADADRARQSAMQPKFRRWTGEGRVSVQIQGGMQVDELLAGTDTRVRVGGPPVSDGPVPKPFSWPVCRAKRFHMRISSGEKLKPIWAEWPLIMSRDIPTGSVIKVVTVSRYRDGTRVPRVEPRSVNDNARWRWTLHLTLELPTEAARPAPAAGVVAMNLGFCQRPGGIRSGYIVADDGHEEEILVPTRDIEAIGKADHIRSLRDLDLDAMRSALCVWLTAARRSESENGDATEGTAARCPEIRDVVAHASTAARRLESENTEVVTHETTFPEWLVAMTQAIHAWRSHDRFRFLALTWRHRRFPGDEAVFELLEAWRRRDLHLDQYEHGLRTTALRRRRETYRIIAARLAAKYRTLVVDDNDLRNYQLNPKPESDAPYMAHVKQQQRIAAGSELRGVMLNAFSGRHEKASGAWMTKRCMACGDIDYDWVTNDGSRDHECPACHAVWDRDANFCRNLLRERSRPDHGTETARSPNQSKAKKTRQQRLRGTTGDQKEPTTARE